MKRIYLLTTILLLGLLLRVIGINLVPPSLNWDEVSHGYNAYSILQTGKDEWGVSLPSIFRAYGDYKLPVYIYATIPSIIFFDLTALGVRAPSIIAGVFLIFYTYKITKLFLVKNQKKEEIALLSALLVALEPWSLFLSRGAFEANLSLALIVSGMYYLIKGVTEKGNSVIVGTILLGLSVWTYNSARIFTPLMVFAVTLIYLKDWQNFFDKKRKIVLASLLLGLLFFIPMVTQLLNPTGNARYQNLRIIDEGAIAQINESRNMSPFPSVISTLIHNKVTFFSSRFLANYFSHFNPQYLFFEGGDHYQFSVPQKGLLYIVGLPFIVVGLFNIISSIRKNRSSQMLFAWLIFAPIASSVTRDSPHVLRSMVILPLPMIFAGIGVIVIANYIKSKNENYSMLLVLGFIILQFMFLADYLETYAKNYRISYSWAWQYGYQEAIAYIGKSEKSYDQIIMTKKYGEPHEFILFYNKVEPDKYTQNENLIRFEQSNWWWVDRFSLYNFVNDWDIPREGSSFTLESGGEVDCINKSCLLISSPGNAPSEWSKIETVNYLDGSPVFEIYEN